MTASEGQVDHYAAVLADLRAQRDRIDHAIAVIENLRAGTPLTASIERKLDLSQSDSPPAAGEFLGMTIADAARKLLATRRRTMTTTEIHEEFKRGGLVLTSADPVNVIGSVLTRRSAAQGDVVRPTRGQWGLAEWYPNRKFGKKPGKPGEATNADPSGPEQPSAPTPNAPPA